MLDPKPDATRGSLPAATLAVIQRCEQVLLLAAFLVLVLVVFADVVNRELNGAGLYWASRTGVWANVIVVMTGFGLASSGGAHLRPRFADNWLPERYWPALETLQHLVMALFCLTIGLLAARVVWGSFALGELSIDLFLPIWPIQLFLPLAFLTGAIRHGFYAGYPALRPTEAGATVFAPSADAK